MLNAKRRQSACTAKQNEMSGDIQVKDERMIMTRYWLAADGAKIEIATGEWHQRAARKCLRRVGVAPKDTDADLYRQMFEQGFMRVAEVEGALHADNDNRQPSEAQQRFLRARQDENVTVLLNIQEFQSTRGDRVNCTSRSK